jgi:hypothetical protein
MVLFLLLGLCPYRLPSWGNGPKFVVAPLPDRGSRLERRWLKFIVDARDVKSGG